MNEGEITNPPAPVGCCGVRHWQMALHFAFYVIVFGIVVSISSTLTPMIITTPKLENISMLTISGIVSSYMYAFIATELFSGLICKRFGFKWPMVIFMVVISIATLNLPTLAREYGANGVIVCRVVQGLCIGLLFSMPADAISRWVPARERTTLGTAVYASAYLGQAIALIMGEYISSTNLKWSFVYTQSGYLAIIWAILMAIYGADSPEEYEKEISETERDYIVQNRGNVITKKKLPIPWRQIFTSMAFWAIVVAQIGACWVLYVLTSNLPIFLRMNYEVEINSKLFCIINLITWVLSFSISGIAQSMINSEKTTTEQSRKIFNTIGTWIPAIFLIFFSFGTRGNQYFGIAMWAIMSVTFVGTICGSKLNANDITTNFAPIVYGTATWIAVVFNLISVIVLSHHMFDNWNVVFIYTAVLAFLTNAFFLKYGSGEEQYWNNMYEVLDEEAGDLSNSASRTSVDEKKYLLFIRKQ